MWLINTTTLALEFFTSPKKVPFAILSHTWEDEEVTFLEFHQLDTASSRKGFAKIARTCSIARARGLCYAWVDTCCINKESSAELSEAINSMFRWYKNATVCLVFLSDLVQEHESRWVSCRWFSRGWTLQELIAPPNVEFYDARWSFKGTKKSLLGLLSSITGVDYDILSGQTRLAELSVARKMSWAARRRTTRDEDIAYCLMGLFDLNMPLLYGEGQKAFVRLQQQILEQTRDLGLLAWTAQGDPHPYEDYEDGNDMTQQFRGVLASSPLEFAACRSIVSSVYARWAPTSEDFTITSKALRCNWPLAHDALLLERKGAHALQVQPVPMQRNKTPRDFVLRLRCLESELIGKTTRDLTIAIVLRQTSKGYVRTGFRKTYYILDAAFREKQQEVYFTAPTHVSPYLSRKICSQYTGSLWLPSPTTSAEPQLQEAFAPPELYDQANRVFRLDGGPGTCRLYLHFSIDLPESLRPTDNGNRLNHFDFLLVTCCQRRDPTTTTTLGHKDTPSAFSCVVVPETSQWYPWLLRLLREHSQLAIDKFVETNLSSYSRPLPHRVELNTRDAEVGELLLSLVRVPMEEFKLVDSPAKDDHLYSIQVGWRPWVST